MTIRTVTLPKALGASWDGLAWPIKAPGDDLEYQVDAADWLRDAGLALVAADASVAPNNLVIRDLTYAGTPRNQVLLRLAGGTAGSTPVVTVTLYLTGGRRLVFRVEMPVGPDLSADLAPFVPSNALVAGGQPLTIGGALLAP